LIKYLIRNARTPYTKIAEELGVSEAAIRKRVRRLEEKGIIKKYTIEVDIKALGYNIDVLIGIDTSPEKFIDTIKILADREDVIELYTSTGDHMMMIRMWFKDSNELNNFIKYLNFIDGVTRVCPAIIIEKIK